MGGAVLQDDWARIIKFLETLAHNEVSLQAAVLKDAVTALSLDSASFCRLCPKMLPESVGFDINDDAFTLLGGDLLNLSPALRKLRYELVRSRRLSENEFFSRVFCGLMEQLCIKTVAEDKLVCNASFTAAPKSPACVLSEKRPWQNAVDSKWVRIMEFFRSITPSADFDSMQASNIEETLAALTKNAKELCRLCPNMLPEFVGFDINDDHFSHLGQDLLEISAAIRQLRYELVRNRRLSENEFFSRVFCGLLEHLGIEILARSDRHCGGSSACGGIVRWTCSGEKILNSQWERVIKFLESLAPSDVAVQVTVVEKALTALTTDATEFCRLCPNVLPSFVGFDINDDKFTLLGQDLLELSPGARWVRYELVRAARLSENEFFSRLFCGLLAQLCIENITESPSENSANLATSLRSPVCAAAAEESEEVEYTLLNIPRSVAYQVDATSSDARLRSEEWKKSIWQGRCRVLSKGTFLMIKLVHARTDDLFAECTIPSSDYEKYVAQAIDSSTSFVLKIGNGTGDKLIGLGFDQCCDAADFKICLEDFKMRSGMSDGGCHASLSKLQGNKSTFSLMEGQTIKLKLKGKASKSMRDGEAMQEAKIMAPPPVSPWSLLVPPAPSESSTIVSQNTDSQHQDMELGDFGDFQSAQLHGKDVETEREEPQSEAGSPPVQNLQELATGIQRSSFSIPAGTACVRRVPWPFAATDTTPVSVLQWKIVVLRELTVDLRVHAVVRTCKTDAICKDIVLQRQARGEHFVGTFAPVQDRRLVRAKHEHNAHSATLGEGEHLHIAEIVFSFSNTFSWFNGKDVEMITLFEDMH